MLLSKHTAVRLQPDQANIISHMCYAAYKLWNVCNYERIHHKEEGLEQYPDWYYQKSAHKEDLWYKSLPSQTAQEVLKQLDKSWKSFYVLKESGGIKNPHPPYFKQEGMAVTYMQMGIVHRKGAEEVRLSISRKLKGHMREKYQIHDDYLYLKNQVFQDMDMIKQIKIYPPEGSGNCKIIIIYEVPDMEKQEDNGRYLSIDLGLHNLLTCYDSRGRVFICGRQYLSISRKYDKEIARVQAQWGKAQAAKGVEHPRPSKHVRRLYEKKRNCIKDYLHKVTRNIVSYCIEQDIHTVVAGDIRGIRGGTDFGRKINQKLHSLPYEKLYGMMEYKLARAGIRFVRQKEAYTSQCPPDSSEISKEYARKANRRHRGLYTEGNKIWNADAVGAYNILRKYTSTSGREIDIPVSGLDNIRVIKVAV